MQYNNSFTENIHSYVNNINTREGGTHVSGFRRAVAREFGKYGEDSGMFSKLKFKINTDDFREGMTAVVSVKVPEPQFKGQTKGELGNSEVTGIVSRAMGNALKIFLEENPSKARRIVEKVILAATARHAARKARETVQRKNVLAGGGLPGKTVRLLVEGPGRVGDLPRRGGLRRRDRQAGSRPRLPGHPAVARQDPQRREGDGVQDLRQ